MLTLDTKNRKGPTTQVADAAVHRQRHLELFGAEQPNSSPSLGQGTLYAVIEGSIVMSTAVLTSRTRSALSGPDCVWSVFSWFVL